ncbi:MULTISPECIES: endonuclease MutS2 [Prochlorococcus]|uniref:endonuclease MutS2 n=1 Tax=Prochlorococcus TaxID=1218 RepID=UPI000533A4F3|nr:MULTISPECIES: endonuclease MutS2 [Prochlorococcus]KGG13150.1 Recombination inhibitory protein MutS2 [Prochlorococcus sp. MIT 0601]
MSQLPNNLGPDASHQAFQETLDLLDWHILCSHLSTFAHTSQGKRKCNSFVIPTDIDTTQRRLSETLEILLLDETLEGGLSFLGVHDLDEIISHCFKGGVATGEELLKIAETLRAGRRIRRMIEDVAVRPVTSSLVANLTTLPELEKILVFGIEEGGRIADRASENLYKLRSSLNDLRNERRERLQALIRKNNAIIQDTIISERYGRPVISLKTGTADQIPGVVHDSSASGNTIFLEPQIVIQLGNKILEVQNKILSEEKRLLAIWSKLIKENYHSIFNLCRILLDLEFALARARYGAWLDGVLPSVENDKQSPFFIKEFRHPLLVWQQKKNSKSNVVPVSFEVCSSLRVVTITGPNTGGKTIALKSFGLLVLMARSGMLLPCIGNPCLPWCDQVLADIGDEQSLQQNLSTFSGHIVRIARILDAIDSSSGPTVVLLDEIGAGTDPTEGSALAIALLRTLADRARITIATTHLGELKALKYNDSRFENASVAFDSSTIRPTYNLQWGIPGRSNALAIAIRLGLDPEITALAKNLIAPKGSSDVNHVISGLEDQRKSQQKAAEDAAALLARTELLYEEILSKWEQQREHSRKWKEDGRKLLEISIRQGQKEVRDLIRRLREEGASGDIARKTGQRLKQIELESHERLPTKTSKLQEWIPKIGDRVRLIALAKAGEVIAISEDGMHLTVLCGIFRSTVDLIAVETLDGRKPTQPKTSVEVNVDTSIMNSSLIKTKRNTVDVRGLRVHEAESVVEDVIRNSTGKIWVIHGIGTGKLKKGLREWLSLLPYVKDVEDADPAHGGAACSVVSLR